MFSYQAKTSCNFYLIFSMEENFVFTGGIDDVAVMIEGGSTALNNSVPTIIHQKAARWAQLHASVFAPQKYELIHFIHRQNTKRSKDKMLDLTSDIGGHVQVVEQLVDAEIEHKDKMG